MTARKKIRYAILRLLEEKSADDLTVGLVCSKAGISKQTLYNNYYGVFDVIEELVFEMLENSSQQFACTGNWIQQLNAQIHKASECRTTFLHIFNSKYGEQLLRAISDRAESQLTIRISKCAVEQGVQLSEADINGLTIFYKDMFTSIFRRMIDDGLSENPNNITDRLVKLVSGHIETSVSRFGHTSM